MEDSERRKFPRVKCAVSVEYLPNQPATTVPFATATKNISQDGICLILFEEITKGQILNLTLSFPETFDSIHIRGTVAWISHLRVGGSQTTEAYEAGIRFTDITDADRTKLTYFMAKKKA